jgi:hypothetical protein
MITIQIPKKISILLFAALLAAPMLLAGLVDNPLSPKNKSVPQVVAADELIIKVDGVVCSFCANGLRKGLCKLNFVDTKQKGKGISLDAKKQLLTIRLKKDAKPDLKKVFESIRKGGYKPVEAYSMGKDGKSVRTQKADK